MIEKYILISFIFLIILICLLNIIYYNNKKKFFDNNKNNILKDANWTILILNDFKSELLNKKLKENYSNFMKEMIIFVNNYNIINGTKWWIFNIFQTKIEYLKDLSKSELWINDITINFNNIFDFYLYNKKPDYIANEPKTLNNKLVLPPVFKDAPLPPFLNFKESSVNNIINSNSNSNSKNTVLVNNKTNYNLRSTSIISSNNKIDLSKSKQIVTYRPRQVNNNNTIIRQLNTNIIKKYPRDTKTNNNQEIKKNVRPYISSKNIITTPSPKQFTKNKPIINNITTPSPKQFTKNSNITTPASMEFSENKNSPIEFIISSFLNTINLLSKDKPIINNNSTPSLSQSTRNKSIINNNSTTSLPESTRNNNNTEKSPIELILSAYFNITNLFSKNKEVITEEFKINSRNNSLPEKKNNSKDKKIIINGDKSSNITIPSSLDGKYGNLNIHVNYNSENSVNHLNNNKTNYGANNLDANNLDTNNLDTNNSILEYTSDNSSRIYTNKDWIYPEKCLNNSECCNNYYNSTNYKNGYYNANDNNNFIQSLNNAPEDPITSIGNYNPINNYISANSFYR